MGQQAPARAKSVLPAFCCAAPRGGAARTRRRVCARHRPPGSPAGQARAWRSSCCEHICADRCARARAGWQPLAQKRPVAATVTAPRGPGGAPAAARADGDGAGRHPGAGGARPWGPAPPAVPPFPPPSAAAQQGGAPAPGFRVQLVPAAQGAPAFGAASRPLATPYAFPHGAPRPASCAQRGPYGRTVCGACV